MTVAWTSGRMLVRPATTWVAPKKSTACRALPWTWRKQEAAPRSARLCNSSARARSSRGRAVAQGSLRRARGFLGRVLGGSGNACIIKDIDAALKQLGLSRRRARRSSHLFHTESAGRPHPTGELSHGLGKRIDHEQRTEPLTRVQILRVQPIASSVEISGRAHERYPRAPYPGALRL